MNVDGTHRRSLWPADDRDALFVIDQRRLPHEFVVARLDGATAVDAAIRHMAVRGAPLIGATAAYGPRRWWQSSPGRNWPWAACLRCGCWRRS